MTQQTHRDKKIDDPITILTVREVAVYLRMSEAKVYRLARQRRLPVIRIGKTWRFRKDLLDRWLIQSTEFNLKTDGEVLGESETLKPSAA